MLYLKYPAQAADEGVRQVPLSEQTALQLERALLSDGDDLRRLELQSALAEDPEFRQWALRIAELRLNRTINRPEEAAAWLAECLAAELVSSLGCERESSEAEQRGIEWRLPAIATKLNACDQELASFHRRLEEEKLESLKELAYGASHEINNPLANIAARAQTLLPDETDPERVRKLQAIHRQAMRAHEMISDLMLYARPPKLNAARFDLRQLVSQIAEELHDLAEERKVELTCTVGDAPVEVNADETQLGVAIRAVVQNAMEAVAAGGHVSMSLGETTAANERRAQIVVRDDGPGISDRVRQHLFDPFFSGREAGRGLGFGLSKCWRIVTDHGGQVVVERPTGGGAEFVILLPLGEVSALSS